MTGVDVDALARWVAAVVPESAAGPRAGLAALRVARALEADRPGWGARFDALAARADPSAVTGDDPEARWAARLIAQAHVADARTWRDLGWSPATAAVPEGTDLPGEVLACVVDRAGLRARYDAVVIGSGAGGSVAAQELAEAGRTVLVVERGAVHPTEALARDHLRGPGVLDCEPHEGAALPSARVVATLGGATRVHGGQAWRLAPDDFRMASIYGVPEGSAVADWPVDYAAMERYYAHAEFEWGVSGATDDPAIAGARSGPYPLPPMPRTRAARVLKGGADSLGWRTGPVPLLVNSEPYRGRPACVRCAQCAGFACPVGAKAGAQNTTLWRAARTSRLGIVASTRASRLETDSTGRVTGVLLRGRDGDGPWEQSVDADEVVLAAGAIETARLLLASRTPREPAGVGNGHDQVGRHLQRGARAGAVGVFDDEVADALGPGPAIATGDFRHGVPGVIGGGVLANDGVLTPACALAQLQDAGLLPYAGDEVLTGLRDLMPRMLRVVGAASEVSSAHARVVLDRDATDADGLARVRVEGSAHPETERTRTFLTERAEEWLRAAGAERIVPLAVGARPGSVPDPIGTCRMGEDPATSVLDPEARVWGHENVRVVDASALVSAGGVDPVLTTIANAYRVMEAAVGARDEDDAYAV